MDRQLLWALVAVIGEQLGRRFVHPYFGVVFVPLVLTAMVASERWRHRQARRRLRRITELPEEEQRAAADALPEKERSVARLRLGLIDSATDSPKQEEIFAYSRVQVRGATLVYWSCIATALIFAGFGYAHHISSSPDFWSWFGLVLGFLGGAILMRWARHQQRTRFFVNQFAIGEIKPSGERIAIPWTQLTWIRNRRWTYQVEFHGGWPARKIAVPYYIDNFARLMEVVAAQLQFLYAPKAGEPGSETGPAAETPAAAVPENPSVASSTTRRVLRGLLVSLLLGAIWLLVRAAGLGLTHRIDDRARFLARSDVRGLDDYLRQVYRESGVDIRFVFVDSVPGGSLEAFAVREARALGIGRELDSRGLLLAYEVSRRRLRIEVGPGLQDVFTDRFVAGLARDQVRNVFDATNPSVGLRLTLFVLHARLRRAALGEEYDPHVVEYIDDPRMLATGGGATVADSEDGLHTMSGEHGATDTSTRFQAQPTVEQAYRQYLEWLRRGGIDVSVALFTQPSQAYLANLPERRAFSDYALFLELGRRHQVLVRGNLALLYFTDDPLVSPHFFRHADQGWQMDVLAEVRDTRNFAGGPWTWTLVDRRDEFNSAFFDRYTAFGPILRLAGGDNRPIPTRTTEFSRWHSRPGAGDPPGVAQLTVTEAAQRISGVRGRPAVVVLYQTWDNVSEELFPAIVQLARRCEAAGGAVLAFSIDGNWNAVKELPGFLRQHDAPFAPVHLYQWPKGMLTRTMAPLGIRIGVSWSTPLVAVLDRNGTVLSQAEGTVAVTGCS